MSRIYACHLPGTVSRELIVQLFESCGPIKKIDGPVSSPPGWMIEYTDPASAKKAVEKLNYTLIDGKQMLILPADDETIRIIKDGITNGRGCIVIANLAEDIDACELHEACDNLGEIIYCRIPKNDQGKNKGYCYVQFRKADDAAFALQHLKDASISGRLLKVCQYPGISDKCTDKGKDIMETFPESLDTPDALAMIKSLNADISVKKRIRGNVFVVHATRESDPKRLEKEEFSKCKDLTNVEIPASVEEIGESCFSGHSSLSCVTFEKGCVLKRIGKKAFRWCRSLTDIEIPASVEELGDMSLQCGDWTGASSLSSVTFAFGSVLKNIGNSVFSGSVSLTEITIPASVENIGASCFYGCSALSSVTFARESVLRCIGREAFSGCNSLTEIEIPASVEEIGVLCFHDCKSLSCVSFAAGSVLKHIEKDTFRRCYSLTSFEIPAGIENLTQVNAPVLSTITFARSGLLKRIDEEAFCLYQNLKEIEIPATVEEIGGKCFYRCSSLSRVTFQSGSVLKYIRNEAFSECRELLGIEIPASTENIGGWCFFECSSLSSVTFASGSVLKSIGNEAFSGCNCLTAIEIPASVEEIGDNGFRDCKSLSSVTFASGSVLKMIGREAFRCCESLQEIEIPASVETIGNNCFCPWYDVKNFEEYGPSVLSRVTFAKGSVLKSFGDFAFRLCKNLQQIEIPASVETIGERCFCDCSSLSRVTFASGSCLEQIRKKAFGNCKALKEIEIPSSVESIGDRCFEFCSTLSSCRFANVSSLKRVGELVFRGCRRLKRVKLPPAAEVAGSLGGPKRQRMTDH